MIIFSPHHFVHFTCVIHTKPMIDNGFCEESQYRKNRSKRLKDKTPALFVYFKINPCYFFLKRFLHIVNLYIALEFIQYRSRFIL
jgi:hypothetical protein